MEYDVVIVGAGPAGLAASIRLKQLAAAAGREVSVCIIEKGSEVGAHILSGAVFEPRALDELLPNWRAEGAPLQTAVVEDRFLLLTARRAFRLPPPPQMNNHGNYIISLGNLCRWLATTAEAMGVEIYAGFAGTELLTDGDGRIAGVATGAMGIGKDGGPDRQLPAGRRACAPRKRSSPKAAAARSPRSSPNASLCARTADRRPMRSASRSCGRSRRPSTAPASSSTASAGRSIAGPMAARSSIISRTARSRSASSSGSTTPTLISARSRSFSASRPTLRSAPIFAGGRRIAYGARALNEGGFQAIPQLDFPGGLVIGCAAGFVNVPKIKGNHTAMKSGMVAAETVFRRLCGDVGADYKSALAQSWVWPELQAVRNIRPGFRWGLWAGLANAALDTYVLRGKAPWTFRHHADNLSLERASAARPIVYPKPDGVLTFDRLSSVFISNTNHAENQPPHLRLKDAATALDVNYALYDSPEQRYCPAGVYEIVTDAGGQPRLQINAQNCVHCKTCDIKDPTQNIDWVCPEGGGGPNYPNM